METQNSELSWAIPPPHYRTEPHPPVEMRHSMNTGMQENADKSYRYSMIHFREGLIGVLYIQTASLMINSHEQII